jgi:serine phosphatase RsbU (regulator of sigma subunit)
MSRLNGNPQLHLRLHAVNVYVRDQEQSVRFYRDQLGFDLAFDALLPSGRRWVAVSPPDGSAVLTLIQPDPESYEYSLIGRNTQVVFVTDNLAAKFAEWRNRGVRFRHTPRLRRVHYDPHSVDSEHGPEPPWGGVFTRFEDLDRNTFALVSFDEVSRAVEAQRRAIIERQEAERRIAQELEFARQVQARLFPQMRPEFGTLDYAGICLQARQVGGDYYDFLRLGDQRLGLVIGDIAGKGMPAALLMANLQANLRSVCANAGEQPQRLLRSVNRLFYENTADSAYATLFFGEYDGGACRLRYVNCGHLCALLLRRDDTIERLEPTTTVVGLFKDWDCEVAECQLTAGDTLALYTDGVTESFNEAYEEFGENRLLEAIRRNRELQPEKMVRTILDDVQQFSPHEQHDDITLIVAKCRDC